MFITDAWDDLLRFVFWMAPKRRSPGGVPPSGGGGGGGGEGGNAPDPEKLFREAYETHFRPVCRFFVNKGFPREDAIELTQETFFRVYRYIGRFRNEASLGTWIYNIATNVWRNELRRLKSKKRAGKEVPIDGGAENEEPSQVPRDPHPGALEDLLADEKKRKLYEALKKLPPRMRHCVLLRIHGNLRYREIAAVMKISIGTVKAQLSQAQERLIHELGDYFDLSDPQGDPDGE